MSEQANHKQKTYRLLLACPDRPGIVATLASIISEAGGNITSAEQRSSKEGRFFLRCVWTGTEGLQGQIEKAFPEAAIKISSDQKKKIAILLSRETHCLADLLWKERQGDLPVQTSLVASNHETGRSECAAEPFFHVPQGEDRLAGEQALLDLLPSDLDFIVLARYMRILSADFIDRAGVPIINIHHSFLPAFPGAGPYEQAYERGVKIIGATAHFVVPELDAGPIISQGTRAVSHKDSPDDLRRIGQNQEREVLAEAVRAQAEDRILLDGNKTVVFS